MDDHLIERYVHIGEVESAGVNGNVGNCAYIRQYIRVRAFGYYRLTCVHSVRVACNYGVHCVVSARSVLLREVAYQLSRPIAEAHRVYAVSSEAVDSFLKDLGVSVRSYKRGRYSRNCHAESGAVARLSGVGARNSYSCI